jgi:hypothetical protein
VGPRVGYHALRGWLERFCAAAWLDLVDTPTSLRQAALRPGDAIVWSRRGRTDVGRHDLVQRRSPTRPVR